MRLMRPNLDGILSSFNKTIDKLKDLEQHHGAIHTDNTKMIEILNQDNEELKAEIAKASSVREKIEALVA